MRHRPLRLLARGLLPLLVLGLGPCLLVAPAATGALSRLRLVVSSPGDGQGGVSGVSTVSLQFSAPLAAGSPMPTITPRVAGTWTEAGRSLTFTPSGAYPPDTTITVSVPGGANGIGSRKGALLHSSATLHFTTGDGTVLRAEQLLAELNYLPVSWHPARRDPSGRAAYERAVFDPPKGRFQPIGQMPTQLKALWQPGVASAVYHSALGAFQRSAGLPATGALAAATWSALSRAARLPGHDASRTGFTYAVANERLPETLTIWQGGRVVLNTLANTGIAESPTADGTYAVYEKLQSQIMQGTTPWGTTYADPVAFIDYFNGSDAVHFMDRASYGFPQSLGCVEVPLEAAERAYGYLTLGTLVTVVG